MHRRRPRWTLRACLLAVALPSLAAVFAASTTAFAAEAGSVSAAVTAADGASLLTLASGAQLPEGIETLRHTTAIDSAGRIETLRRPSWSPIPGAVGAVEQAGDLYVVDTRRASGPVDVTLHIANLGSLADAYTTLLLPVGVWRAKSSGGWARATAEPLYLTNTGQSLSVRLAAGAVYDLTLETGGTWAAAASTASEYAPAFYATLRQS